MQRGRGELKFMGDARLRLDDSTPPVQGVRGMGFFGQIGHNPACLQVAGVYLQCPAGTQRGIVIFLLGQICLGLFHQPDLLVPPISGSGPKPQAKAADRHDNTR